MDTVECGRIYLNRSDNFIIVFPRPVDALISPIVVVLSFCSLISLSYVRFVL